MTRRIVVPQTSVGTLFGPCDENLRHVEALLNVKIRTQGHELMIDGHPRDTARVERWVGQVTGLLGDGHSLSDTDIRTAAKEGVRLYLEALQRTVSKT